jgi:hypothetical protein
LPRQATRLAFSGSADPVELANRAAMTMPESASGNSVRMRSNDPGKSREDADEHQQEGGDQQGCRRLGQVVTGYGFVLVHKAMLK